MNLFVYGSLMFPDVLQRLLQRVPPNTPATLPDYRRGVLQGKTYPGITPAADYNVIGMMLGELDDHELIILDAFEDEIYDRVTVLVQTADGRSHQAFAYCVAPSYRRQILREDWDVNVFRERHLPGFIARI